MGLYSDSSKNFRSGLLKQVKLSETFSSSKRALSLSSASKAAQKKARTKIKRSISAIYSPSELEIGDSDDDDARDKAVLKATNKEFTVKQAVSKSKPTEVVPMNMSTELEDLDRKDVLEKHYVYVQDQMGGLEPIHGENETKIHHILRVFDLTYKYGPCVGIPRIDRWNRAQAMKLNPPEEVRLILETQEARNKNEYKQCIFYKFDSGTHSVVV